MKNIGIHRRGLMLGMAAAVLAGPAAALEAASVWAPRPITPEEEPILRAFLIRLRRRLPQALRAGSELFETHARVRIPEAHLFKPGTADVSESGIRVLDEVARGMTREPKVRLEIVSHHHSDGQSYRAHIISTRRASAVESVLMSRRVPRDRLLATGLGDRFPLTTNATDAGRAENRRTDLVFRPA